MDASIEPIIAGYRTGIDSFTSTLGADHPKVIEAAAALAELEAIGERSADVMAFMGAAGAQMERVGTLMGELGSATPAPGAGAAAADGTASPGELPSAKQVARAFHMAYDQMDKSAAANQSVVAIYERIFAIEAGAENAAVFNRRMAEEVIYAHLARLPQLDTAREAIRHIRDNELAQPGLVYHYELLAAAMERATSATEVEYEVNLLVEYNAAENEWDTIFCHYAIKAIAEVAGFYMDASLEQQQNVETAYRFVADFFGRDWNSMWQCPRVWEQWCMIFAKSKSAWVSERGCGTAEEARDFHTRTFEGIMQNRKVAVESVALGPPERQQGFRLWSQEVHMDQLLDAYRAPARPPVDFSS